MNTQGGVGFSCSSILKIVNVRFFLRVQFPLYYCVKPCPTARFPFSPHNAKELRLSETFHSPFYICTIRKTYSSSVHEEVSNETSWCAGQYSVTRYRKLGIVVKMRMHGYNSDEAGSFFRKSDSEYPYTRKTQAHRQKSVIIDTEHRQGDAL